MLRPIVALGMTLLVGACASPPPPPDVAPGPAADAQATPSPAPESLLQETRMGMRTHDSTDAGPHRGPMRSGSGGAMTRDSARGRMGERMHRHAEGMQGRMGTGADREHGMQGERGSMHRQGGMRGGMGRGMNPDGSGAGASRGMGGALGEVAPHPVPAELAEGERIFQQICSACHTMDPPANLAPPMRHVARHLRQTFDSEEDAVAHVREFLPEPSRERSILPDMPHERFGLMAPQPLPPELLDAVARYIWFVGGAG